MYTVFLVDFDSCWNEYHSTHSSIHSAYEAAVALAELWSEGNVVYETTDFNFAADDAAFGSCIVKGETTSFGISKS